LISRDADDLAPVNLWPSGAKTRVALEKPVKSRQGIVIGQLKERYQHGLRSDWQMTDARARGSEDGISNRRRNRRGRRFTKPNWCFRTWQELHLEVLGSEVNERLG
jgi:hypothetical protein